jgi:hypothetical protein
MDHASTRSFLTNHESMPLHPMILQELVAVLRETKASYLTAANPCGQPEEVEIATFLSECQQQQGLLSDCAEH